MASEVPQKWENFRVDTSWRATIIHFLPHQQHNHRRYQHQLLPYRLQHHLTPYTCPIQDTLSAVLHLLVPGRPIMDIKKNKFSINNRNDIAWNLGVEKMKVDSRKSDLLHTAWCDLLQPYNARVQYIDPSNSYHLDSSYLTRPVLGTNFFRWRRCLHSILNIVYIRMT